MILAINANPIRIPEMSHQLTPTREATVDSMNKLWEKDSITAIVNTSLTVKSNETIAPIAAYKLRAFPNTKGTAASPERHKTPTTWINSMIINGKIRMTLNTYIITK